MCLDKDTICVNTHGSYECVRTRDFNQINEPSMFANGSEYERPIDYDDIDEEGAYA